MMDHAHHFSKDDDQRCARLSVCPSEDRQELILDMLGVADFRFDYRQVPYHLTYLGRTDRGHVALSIRFSFLT